jgi:hypothetical protein
MSEPENITQHRQSTQPTLQAEVPDETSPDPGPDHRQSVLGQLALEHEVVQAVKVLERQTGDQVEVGRQAVHLIRSFDLGSIGLPIRTEAYVWF